MSPENIEKSKTLTINLQRYKFKLFFRQDYKIIFIGRKIFMSHIIYILAFTVIATLAVTNLISSLITLSTETQRIYPANSDSEQSIASKRRNFGDNQKLHPELLDERGMVIEEPLLVMRSVSVEDARQQLDNIYHSSPTKTDKEE